MYLLEMAMNLLLCGFPLFMFCWTRYHAGDGQNIRKNGHRMLETSFKVVLQPEGGNYRHLDTVMN